MKTTPFISPTLIHAIAKYISSLGLDPASLPAISGQASGRFFDPEKKIPLKQFSRLWTDFIRLANDPDFGLHLAESTRSQPGGEVLTAILFNCPTVKNAMQKLARYHCLTTDLIQIQIDEQDEFIHYAWIPTLDTDFNDRHISEAVMGRLFFMLQDLSDQKVMVSEVRFRHPQPENISEHQRIFNGKISFDQLQDELVLRRKETERSIPLADPRLLERLDSIAGQMLIERYPPDTLPEQVSVIISKLLRQGEKPNINTVARKLAVSIRQLQNKLKQAGATYRILLEQVRKEKALVYLNEPNLSILDAAFLLGFSDQSSFNHAFKRWTGLTPTEYQQKAGNS